MRKLVGWSNDNLIQLSKDMSDAQIQRIYRATSSFLNSKTSLITGVKKAIKETIKSIGKDVGVSKDEAESLYRSLTEDTFKYFNKNDVASEIWNLIEEAKDFDMSRKRFGQKLLEISKMENDKEVSTHIKAFYERYVKN